MSIEHGPRYSRKAEAVLIPWRLRVSAVYQQYCKEMDNTKNLDTYSNTVVIRDWVMGIGPLLGEGEGRRLEKRP